MKAIIHIGMPKTGSSSIQEFLALNADQLAQRGFRYARFHARFGSQFELGVSTLTKAGQMINDFTAKRVLGLHDLDAQKEYTARYLDFLDTGLNDWNEPIFLASSEHLVPWLPTPELVGHLQDNLQARFADGVRYVLYIRPQIALLTSSYSERMRRGEKISLDTHLEQAVEWANYNQLVWRWEAAIGAENLDVRLMIPDTLESGDLLTDFCAAVGVDPAGLTRPEITNPSLSRAQIQWRYRLNQHLRPLRENGKPNKIYSLAAHLGDALNLSGNDKLKLTEPQREMVLNSFAQTNEWLRERRFPHRETLF